MVNFQIKLDEMFDELIIKAMKNKNQVSLNDIISLKSIIIDCYNKDNDFMNVYLRKELKKIDFKI